MKVVNILIYSRLNAVITVHQLVQDDALTWADTPSLLPVPRFENNLMKPMPNFGLILIPSERILNAQDPDSSEIASFTTYRLRSDFNIVGDMYAKKADLVYDLTEFGVHPGRNRKSVSSNPDSDSESSSDDWDCGRNRKLAEVAKIIISAMPSTEVTPQFTVQQLKGNILHKIESRRDMPFQTMYIPDSDATDSKATCQASGYGVAASRCVDVNYRANSSSTRGKRDAYTTPPGFNNSRRRP